MAGVGRGTAIGYHRSATPWGLSPRRQMKGSAVRTHTGATALLIAAITALALLACGGETPLEAQQQAQDATEPQAQVEQEEEEQDGGFDIGNRTHAGVRLTLLAEVLQDANPVNDPVSWAKAGYATSRIDEICNNFDIHEDLDAACDDLLAASGTPWNQLTPVLSAAFEDLRLVVSRREMAKAAEDGYATWDDDIIEFSLRDAPNDLYGHLSLLKSAMQPVADGLRGDLRAGEDLAEARLSIVLTGLWGLSEEDDPDRVAKILTALALDDLRDFLSEYGDETNDFGRELTAGRIVDELDDLGVY